MYKKYSILFVMLLSFSVSAQDIEELTFRLNNIESTNDINKRRIDLQEFSNDIIRIFNDDDSIEKLSDQTSMLKVITSDDGKIKVVAFGANTYPDVFQFEWLVKYHNKVWHFSDEFKKLKLIDISEISLSFKTDNEGLYSFYVKKNKQVVLKTTDLLTKCFFEDMQKLTADDKKDSLNSVINERLKYLWSNEDLFEDDFEQIKHMKTLLSKDKKLKICTYNIQKDEFKQEFFGAVIVNDNGINVNILNDQTDNIRNPERSALTNKKWYGAVYLDIIEVKDGKKNYYTLLGYKGHDEFVKTRVVDVLIVQNGRLRFGAPIFKVDRYKFNRLVYHYSAGTTMMLRYDPKLKMIVMDNLVPSNTMFNGVYQYYGPDFTYNGFKFLKGNWEKQNDIDLRNPKE